MNESRDRPSPLRIAAGLLLLAATWFYGTEAITRPGPIQRVLVEDRATECREHADGPEAFVLSTLRRESNQLATNLRRILLALGAALLIVEGARALGPTRELARSPLSPWILAALLVGGAAIADQLGFLRAAVRDGLFTEEDDASRRRFFGHTVPAASFLNERVAPGAKILVLDFDLKDPQQVKKVGYQIFPRRLFMLPGSTMHIGTATFRRLVRDHAGSLTWLEDAGYDFALDLNTLVTRTKGPFDPATADALAEQVLVPLGGPP